LILGAASKIKIASTLSVLAPDTNYYDGVSTTINWTDHLGNPHYLGIVKGNIVAAA
jgi:hypothetical protein